MRKSSAAVTVGVILSAVMVACGSSSEPDWVRVCEDAQTSERLPESDCPPEGSEGGDGGYSHGSYRGRPRYYPGTVSIPAVGSKLPAGGTTTRPSGTIGLVGTKGGFGTHGGGSGS